MAGHTIALRINPEHFRSLVIGLLLMTGVSAILNSIFS